MQRHTSVYLDMLRFAAALVVFVGHTSGGRLGGGLGWQLVPFMDEAVMMFFVISGYVIGYVSGQRETTWRAYGTARAARIYSVAIPALAATFILDAVGRSLDPALYASVRGGQEGLGGLDYIGAVFFINYLWYYSEVVGTNIPYWSLCYEVWYYVAFGLVMFVKGPWRWWAAGLLLLAVGPRIAGLFPIWLFGLLAYRIGASGRVGVRLGAVLLWGSLALMGGYELWVMRHGALPDVFEAFLRMPNVTERYLIGFLFACHLVGFNAAGAASLRLIGGVARAIRWCAGATFTIYLFHMPLIVFFATINPWPPAGWVSRIAMFGGTLAVLFVIAAFTERRKDVWHRGLVRLFRSRPAVGAAVH